MESIKRTAIVTGGAQGIGREIVKEYLEAGVKVCAFDLNAEQLDSLKAEFAAYGNDLITAAGNVTSYEDVEACVKKAAEAFGRIDILVNNAGGSFGVKGFVTHALPENISFVYTCGPLPMLKALYKATGDVSGEYSLEERMGCGFGACMGCSIMTKEGAKRVCKDGPIFQKEVLEWQI